MSNGGDSNPGPPFDDALAQRLVGKYVLIGFTIEEPDGTLVRQLQIHGTVTFADRHKGIGVSLGGMRTGQEHVLPPWPAAFHEAKPGEYRLRSTGEVIVDPDYTTSWTLTRSPDSKSDPNDLPASFEPNWQYMRE